MPSFRKVWIDLDNTPHVPFFEPIIEELRQRHYQVILTARNAFQVCELASQKGMTYLRIGHHHGKNPVRKLLGLFWRALELMPIALRQKPLLALSHGSRSQIIACNLLRIPTVAFDDYEFSRNLALMRPSFAIVPEMLPTAALCCRPERVRKYPGIKEDVYVSGFRPDPDLLKKLGLSSEHVIATVRPPANEAHYHNPESDVLFTEFMERASRTKHVRVVLLPRNRRQEDTLLRNWPGWFENSTTVIPPSVVDGINLLWHSDLLVSGGGTMNREAAALGVPAYSLFRGRIGAVDMDLQRRGRLVLIENTGDLNRIILEKRPRAASPAPYSGVALPRIMDHIEEIAGICASN